jgi:hypothetical protein
MAEKLSIKRGVEAFAMTCYVSDKALQELESGRAEKIDVRASAVLIRYHASGPRASSQDPKGGFR